MTFKILKSTGEITLKSEGRKHYTTRSSGPRVAESFTETRPWMQSRMYTRGSKRCQALPCVSQSSPGALPAGQVRTNGGFLQKVRKCRKVLIA